MSNLVSLFKFPSSVFSAVSGVLVEDAFGQGYRILVKRFSSVLWYYQETSAVSCLQQTTYALISQACSFEVVEKKIYMIGHDHHFGHPHNVSVVFVPCLSCNACRALVPLFERLYLIQTVASILHFVCVSTTVGRCCHCDLIIKVCKVQRKFC